MEHWAKMGENHVLVSPSGTLHNNKLNLILKMF